MALTKITGEGVGAIDSLDVTGTGGQVTVDANGHITSKQSLDATTAGGRITGASNRGTVSQIELSQTAAGADGGYIRFLTCDSGSTSPTERMRLLSGGGLTFNGDTAAVNALDDYEEGTFTPVIDGEGSCSIGTSSVIGLYTKIGRLVNCSITYSINSVSGGASNLAVDISGLPFTTNTNSNFAATIRSQNLAAACEGVQVIIFNNATSGRIEEFNGQGGTNFSDHVASNSTFIINVTYMTA